ncbi:tripartite tricarboxylate transporter substrate binding protein [Evtepia sp.]|uniref:Bug family tripartite tricarboxylate transporter substrate binding protein n=1 Tax=Evtepia sp. TaxID=2773933 RepID=UPI002A80C060|nr:tripartite tricarboxylate transporter substrate binding protein [Evtepia sp.]MDY4430824.1 tripartite tricarboxylate transporter substrate binding protein [Evtepia sp.]
MKKRKILAMLLAAGMMIGCLAGCGGSAGAEEESTDTQAASTGAYPEKDISGIIQWGAGGGTDSLMRPLATLAEAQLGVSIVVENKTGGTGSIATQYVYDQAADGYTLLMGAENPQLYSALDILELTYADFEPVFLIGDETVGVVVSKNSPYTSLTEIIDAALASPGTVTLSTTGTGGLPWEVASFLTAVTGATFNQIPYDSDATAKAAVLSGECDFTICKVQSGIEDYKAGELKFLSMLATEPVEQMSEVPLITAEYPDFEQYLPWGPFYGVFVKAGTDQAAIDTLSAAFETAFNDASYQDLLAGFNINALGYTGDEAKEYLDNWQTNTTTALVNSGAITKTLSELGIE